MAELLARLRVALRHSAMRGQPSGEPLFVVNQLRVDMAARRVFLGDTEVHLTRIEYRLLTALVQHAGKVITHRQLLKEVWGPEAVNDRVPVEPEGLQPALPVVPDERVSRGAGRTGDHHIEVRQV